MQEEKNNVEVDTEEVTKRPTVEKVSPTAQHAAPAAQATQPANAHQGQAGPQQNVNIIINQPNKSVLVALVLTFFFGPLGMFYSTVLGAVVMLIVSIIVGILTLGIGLLLTQPICMVWGAIAANNANKVVQQRY